MVRREPVAGGLSEKCETGGVVKDFVRGEQWRPNMDSRGGNPQVVSVGSVREWMSIASARNAQSRCGGQQTVAHRNDCRCFDPVFEAIPPRDSPSGDESAVSELADRDGSEEDLVAGHQRAAS